MPRRIAFVGFEGVSSIDLSGPAEAFSRVTIDQGGTEWHRGYEILIVAASIRPFAADCGLIFKPHISFRQVPPLDTVVVPGGMALRDPAIRDPISEFVRQQAAHGRRMLSLGTGVYALAAAGLLSGRKVATHWRNNRDVAMRFPNLDIEDNALFVKDGQFYTSAGATAGIDLALALIEEDYGSAAAMRVARDLVIHVRRTGDQEQYSEQLQFQTESISRLSDMATWIQSHLSQNLSVEALAAKACLCPRQFLRRFKTELGTTPAEFVERARLEEARRRLCASDATIESVAASVGFKSSDVFRRRFEERLKMTPTQFRQRFKALPVAAASDRRRINGTGRLAA